MSASPTPERTGQPFIPLIILIALACLINYVDRGNLSIAAPTLKDELHLNPAQLGILFSALFYTYATFIFVGGWVLDHFKAKWVLAVGFAVWSLATAATGFVYGFATLLAVRLLLGLGESVVFPCACRMIARFVPERFRGMANGVMTTGMKSGPAVGTLGAGLLMAKYGWRPVFVGIGCLSLLWLPAWVRLVPHEDSPQHETSSLPAKASEILLQQSFWAATSGHFCSNYVLYFMLTWLPLYLVQARGLSLRAMPVVAAAYYSCDALSSLCTGSVCDLLVRFGGSITGVRKSSMALGNTLSAVALVGCTFAGPHTYLIWLLSLGIASGMSCWGVLAFAQTLAGPHGAGKWAALQNGLANFAGIASPAITGFLVHWTGRFTSALSVAACVAVLGAFAWTRVVGPGRDLEDIACAG